MSSKIWGKTWKNLKVLVREGKNLEVFLGEGIKLGRGREKFRGSRLRGIKGRIKRHLGRIKWEFNKNVGSRRIKLGIVGMGKSN